MSLIDIARVRVEERYALDYLWEVLRYAEKNPSGFSDSDDDKLEVDYEDIVEALVTEEAQNLRKCKNCKYIGTFDCGLDWQADGDGNPIPKPDGYPNKWFCADFKIREKIDGT